MNSIFTFFSCEVVSYPYDSQVLPPYIKKQKKVCLAYTSCSILGQLIGILLIKCMETQQEVWKRDIERTITDKKKFLKKCWIKWENVAVSVLKWCDTFLLSDTLEGTRRRRLRVAQVECETEFSESGRSCSGETHQEKLCQQIKSAQNGSPAAYTSC